MLTSSRDSGSNSSSLPFPRFTPRSIDRTEAVAPPTLTPEPEVQAFWASLGIAGWQDSTDRVLTPEEQEAREQVARNEYIGSNRLLRHLLESDRQGDDSRIDVVRNRGRRQGDVRRRASQVNLMPPSLPRHRSNPNVHQDIYDALTEYRRHFDAARRRPVFRLERETPIQPGPADHDGLDGLGDRDRSLSPDAVGIWDTLQTTVTPDHQPPSLGSSFASTSASATASRNAVPRSSSTPITTPGNETEPPCDPDDEADGPAQGSDDGQVHREGSSIRPAVIIERPLVDVMAQEDVAAGRVPEDPEWLTGMHRIVSRLASREDIPDEWWAEAGLYRTLNQGYPWDSP